MKSILIIDTPNDCYDCPCYYDERNKCEVIFKNVDDDIEKPSWCPLKPSPERMSWGHSMEWIDGYNACLDEITGETE